MFSARDLFDAFSGNSKLSVTRQRVVRAENAMKLTSRTTFPLFGKEKGTRENGEVMRKTSNSFSDEVALFHEGEYLEKLREFRALVLRRIRAHIDDEDEKEEEEEEEENEDD
jgi:hypothetical protein